MVKMLSENVGTLRGHGDEPASRTRRSLRDRWLRARAFLQSALAVVRAQRQLRSCGMVASSVRVYGHVRCSSQGTIRIGDRTRLFGTVVDIELAAGPRGALSIGRGCSINYGTSIGALNSIMIGDGCYIGQYSIINDSDYHGIENRADPPASAPIVLEDRVWLGARVIVLKGVRIGHDTVIGAGSVVLKDIPPRTVAFGHPARVVRQF